MSRIWNARVKPQLIFGFTRVLRRLWSDESWLIFALKLGPQFVERNLRLSAKYLDTYAELTIRPITLDDVEELVHIYPPEFSSAMSEKKICSDLICRLNPHSYGFIAHEKNGRILGAQWCLDGSQSILHDFAPLVGYHWFESQNLFVIPQARGRRVATHLRVEAFSAMIERGYDLATSLVRFDRYNSIRHNLRFDSRLIGIRSHKTRLGRRRWENTPLAMLK